MTCGDIRKFVHAYLDDEFADEDRREFEEHVESCAICRARTDDERRFHGSLRDGLAALPAEVTPEFLDRIDGAIDAVSRSELAVVRRRRWIGVAAGALAAAAGVTFVVARGATPAEPSVVEAVVRGHQRNLPVEVASADPDSVRIWFRGKVDLPVRPPRPGKPNARLVGGRVSHLREKDAAELVYDVGGRKVSVLIFDPHGLPLNAARRARVRDREVALDGRRGYNVALFQDRGLGYAVAAEGGDDDVLDFVNATFLAP